MYGTASPARREQRQERIAPANGGAGLRHGDNDRLPEERAGPIAPRGTPSTASGSRATFTEATGPAARNRGSRRRTLRRNGGGKRGRRERVSDENGDLRPIQVGMTDPDTTDEAEVFADGAAMAELDGPDSGMISVALADVILDSLVHGRDPKAVLEDDLTFRQGALRLRALAEANGVPSAKNPAGSQPGPHSYEIRTTPPLFHRLFHGFHSCCSRNSVAPLRFARMLPNRSLRFWAESEAGSDPPFPPDPQPRNPDSCKPFSYLPGSFPARACRTIDPCGKASNQRGAVGPWPAMSPTARRGFPRVFDPQDYFKFPGTYSSRLEVWGAPDVGRERRYPSHEVLEG